uniref:Host attachment protein n=1 Tax=Chlorobium chlorochromatii (strain CaD3) TaxID=340177 RepID=Q3ARK0_CHLCH
MKNNTGLWIDHKTAILVNIKGDYTHVQHVESNAESNLKPSGGWKANGSVVAQAVANEHTADERRKHQYHTYYQKVIALLANSTEIALFGPGEAKIELAKEIEKNSDMHKKVSIVETCERMTENQLIAKIKSSFSAKS